MPPKAGRPRLSSKLKSSQTISSVPTGTKQGRRKIVGREAYKGETFQTFFLRSLPASTPAASITSNKSSLKLPGSWWNDPKNQRQFVDWAANRLAIAEASDWYHVRAQDLLRLGGARLLAYNSSCVASIVGKCYPDHQWLPWRFGSPPLRWWAHAAQRKLYIEWLRQERKWASEEDLYKLTRQDFIEVGARNLFKTGTTLYKVVSSLYPSHEWQPWRFTDVKKSSPLWADPAVPRKFLEALRAELRIGSIEQFIQSVTTKDIVLRNGQALLDKYSSLHGLLTTVYGTDHPVSATSQPKYDWKDRKTHQTFLDGLRAELRWERPEDLYQLTKDMLASRHALPILSHYNNSVSELVAAVYPSKDLGPSHRWVQWRFASTPKAWWQDPTNQQAFIEWIKEEKGFATNEEFYGLKQEDFARLGGAALLRLFGNSIVETMKAVVPTHRWLPWRFNAPKNFWKDPKNQKDYLEWLRVEKLGATTLQELAASISEKLIIETGGGGLFYIHNGSPLAMVEAVYGVSVRDLLGEAPRPSSGAKPWRMRRVPRKFWQNVENQRWFFDRVMQEEQWKSLEDCYDRMNGAIISKYRGSGLLANYEDSPAMALMQAYPDHTWLPWKFHSVPRLWWKAPQHQKTYLEWLQAPPQLNVKSLEQWYSKLTREALLRFNGRGLLVEHKNSIFSIMRTSYPNHKWLPWRFQLPQNFWASLSNRLDFLNHLMKLEPSIGFESLEDLYKLDRDTLEAHGGKSLWEFYDRSIWRVLAATFPKHRWQPWRFSELNAPNSQVPSSGSVVPMWWTSAAERNEFVEFLRAKEGISPDKLEEFYMVSPDAVAASGGRALLAAFSFPEVLAEAFPHHQWDASRFPATEQQQLNTTVSYLL